MQHFLSLNIQSHHSIAVTIATRHILLTNKHHPLLILRARQCTAVNMIDICRYIKTLIIRA